MNNQLEYIDDYFQKMLSEKQRQDFESRCMADEAFAKEVAIYISMREVLRQNLLEEKKERWAKLMPSDFGSIGTSVEEKADVFDSSFSENTEAATKIKPVRESAADKLQPAKTVQLKNVQLKKWLSLAAAACIIAFLLIYPGLSNNSARQLVHEYVNSELTISNTMDASRDSLQTGITAYQNKNYGAAITIFESPYASNRDDQQILKYLGQAYLMNKDYENALKYFDLLIERRGLVSNPGKFLKAITLMERNAPGDEQQAKTLFKKVVAEKSEGDKQARVFLDKMN